MPNELPGQTTQSGRWSQDVTWASIKSFLRTPDDYRMDDSMDKAGLSLSVLNVRGKKLHKLLCEQPEVRHRASKETGCK